MPTREQVSRDIRQELAGRNYPPGDPLQAFALQAMEDMNQGMADLDDELAFLADRMVWLAQAPTWFSQRPAAEFEGFVNAKLDECETALGLVRQRWQKHQQEKPTESNPQSS
jgi:hypothetical protein